MKIPIMNFSRSILAQLILIIASASIVAAIASTIGHYIFTAKIIEDSIEQQMASALQLTKDYLEDNYSEELRYDLNLLNSSIDVNNLLGSKVTEQLIYQQNVEKLFLTFAKNRENLYHSIRLIDPAGKEVAIIKDKKRFRKYSSVTNSAPTPSNLLIGDLFARLKKEKAGSILFSKPAFENGKNYFFVGLSKTDPDIGGFGGAIIISFTLDDFTNYLNNFKIFSYSLIWIFTHTGEAIYTVKEKNTINPFPFLYGDEKKPDNILIYTSKRQPESSIENIIQIAIVLPHKARKELLNNLLVITILILVTIIGLGIFLAFLMAKRIIQPITHLTQLSQRVAAGDFSITMQSKGHDEIAMLSQAFNIMIQELDEQRHELRSLANRDTLTQLPNRRQFEEHLSLLVKSCSRNGQSIAVMYIDLDQFKDTNDSFGHPAGDKLIREVSLRLLSTVRKSDLVARLGGDEFAIILNPHRTRGDTELVAQKILSELNKSFTIEKHQIFSGGSIGISIYPEHGKNATEIVKNADAAMYKAKGMGRNSYQFYSSNLTDKANERVIIGSLIRNALTNNQFSLYYQPKIDLTSKKIIGAEALLRWEHKGKIILPSKIIEIAETSGFIEKIDAWVLNDSCKRIKKWQTNNIEIVPISMNISGRLLERGKVIDLLKQVLERHSIDPKWIEIEITENHLVSNTIQTQKSLKVIHSLGVKIAIDDFGTGYSSLGYLKDLLANTLKIDRKFVVNAMTNHTDKEIASAIVKLARSLHMHVVVEGIETSEQETFFSNLGAHSAQGWLYARAMPADQFIDRLQQQNQSLTPNHSPDPTQ